MRGLRASTTALLLALAGCTSTSAHPAESSEQAAKVTPLSQRGIAHIQTADGRMLRVEAEIASNDHDRMRGLMYRTSMPDNAGMYFVFADEGFKSFWMKNTLIPLDMLFIDSKGVVVGIVENAEPRTLTSRHVDGSSKDVLEVNGGWCARNGVRAGDRVRLEGMYALQ
jgi:uncharacterized membrane protein (UPF0127 family)